ncbi:B-cell receptor CD22-like [Gadus macrocephalus]|uniref:B-cell receptor CD22-like n=1 Tax=Gadus macrocephalus TaxID=80720 RepID=UPI0028CB3B7C|nr:B-cell receptor CD22-like [Gadus macrocephalus]
MPQLCKAHCVYLDKQEVLLELTVPWEDRLEEAFERKLSKDSFPSKNEGLQQSMVTGRKARYRGGDPDLQVKVSFPYPTKAKLECHSMCGLAGDPHYIWFRNGQYVLQGMNYWIYIQSGYSYSCAVEGYEHQHSPLVYAPKTPSVTVSPSGEIEEGSSVTLSCSSDANPAANYTWFKVNRDGSSRFMNQGQQLIFRWILSSDSGRYRCDTQNKLGDKCFFISINVKYGPKHISVLSSPSGEIEEGSSVTLSCSSDANPAAEYTWFKNNQSLLWEPSQPHTFPSVRPEDRGTYRCQAENKYGLLRSNLLFMDVKCELNIGLIC